jgi:ubiquinone/menaquinone biosynthesis C-methylase UbiE
VKLNPLERRFVTSPLRRAMQALVVRWFQAVKPLAPGARVLEIGCGAGAGARMVARQFAPGRLVLIDLDLEMVRLARRTLAAAPPTTISLCVADAVRLPLCSAAVDAVFGFGFLHHVPAWRESLTEVHRVLSPGGIYYLEEYYPSLYQNLITRRLAVHPEDDRFGSRDLKEAFDRVGISLQYAFELKRMGILGVGVKKTDEPKMSPTAF